MRIGEIKNIIKKVIDENHMIQINNESVYGEQAYQINNFGELIEALDILSNQKWNDADFAPVQQITSAHERSSRQIILTVDEFNQLNSYIGTINPKVPLYYLTLDSLTEEQDEKTINIKLPPNIKSLEDLIEINKKLESTLKLFNVDGQFEFKGFDKGTEWYVVVAQGVLSYHAIIACLKIAQEYFKARTEYFKSEEAQISYAASLSDSEKEPQKDGFEKYMEKWLKIFIESAVKKAIEETGLNGHTKEELHTKLIKATTKLVEELGEGTEFHLSLNPPPYAIEEGGDLKIDYKKIKESNPKKDEETKSLKAPEESKEAKSDPENVSDS